MLITNDNQPAFGDTLLAITGQDTATQTIQRRGDIVAILNDKGNVIGYNFFNVTQWLGQLTGQGRLVLSHKLPSLIRLFRRQGCRVN